MSLKVNRENGLVATGHTHSGIAEDNSIARLRAAPLRPGREAAMPREFLPIMREELIPNFKGDIYTKNDWGYKSRANQYATSSYPSAQMSPFMVAYPRDDNDIFVALSFAKINQKRVVARSGGHQYSGKSSGGQDTIVLSMDSFDPVSYTHLRAHRD